jgi:hypothetical protein
MTGCLTSSNHGAGSGFHAPGSAMSPAFTASIVSRCLLHSCRLIFGRRSLRKERQHRRPHEPRPRRVFEIFARDDAPHRPELGMHGVSVVFETNLGNRFTGPGEIGRANGVRRKRPGSEPANTGPEKTCGQAAGQMTGLRRAALLRKEIGRKTKTALQSAPLSIVRYHSAVPTARGAMSAHRWDARTREGETR